MFFFIASSPRFLLDAVTRTVTAQLQNDIVGHSDHAYPFHSRASLTVDLFAPENTQSHPQQRAWSSALHKSLS